MCKSSKTLGGHWNCDVELLSRVDKGIFNKTNTTKKKNQFIICSPKLK